jgi:hypothetical protein
MIPPLSGWVQRTFLELGSPGFGPGLAFLCSSYAIVLLTIINY